MRLALLVEVADQALAEAARGLAGYLTAGGIATVAFGQPSDGLLVLSDRPPTDEVAERVLAADGALLLVGPTASAWAASGLPWERAGVVIGACLPPHELRLSPVQTTGVTDRWPPDWRPRAGVPVADKVADDVAVLVEAPVGMGRTPVLTLRGGAGICTLGEGAGTVADPEFRRLLLRWARAALGLVDAPEQRVGMLGYGAIGAEHAAGIAQTSGLRLHAVCDRDPVRVAAARSVAPDVAVAADLDALAAEVDVVVVSTPPDSHAELAARSLAAGRHVVVDKPLTLTTADADRLIAAAESAGRTLLCYQNRRFDPDFVLLRRLVHSGQLGRVFHLESFVGGYAHPCNMWHSDRAVSGGAAFDWGAHYLDWILDLLPGEVSAVSAVEHKLAWHDVTNADHTRITLRCADGAEAEFVCSDLAAAAKPKWYVLGTGGAVVGQWRHERHVARDAAGALVEERFAGPESPSALSLHAPDGSVTTLALPGRAPAPFHRALADRLLTGHPLPFTAADSRRVVAVLEAAAASAAAGGRPVVPAG